MAKWTEAGDALDMSWMQQPVDHVEDKQRLHPIIGETFPGFGESDVAESARMTDEAAIVRVVHGRRVLRPALFLASAGSLRSPKIPSFELEWPTESPIKIDKLIDHGLGRTITLW